ncbi:MAG: hypothetical protein ACPW60_00815 [Methylohalobius sp. ZOD2]
MTSLHPGEIDALAEKVRPAFRARCRTLGVETDLTPWLAPVYLPLAAWVAAQTGKVNAKTPRPLILGINGAQGSGKSTVAALLATLLKEGFGLKAAGLSIDDLYLTRAEREKLARSVHPLLITRGVPGTHDVTLGIATLNTLKNARSGDRTPIPAFDKAVDDRKPKTEWPVWQGPVDVILFEGWCVGTRPQPEAALRESVNDLEKQEDSDGRWRRHVNDQLKGPYRCLFALLDRLLFLQAPDLDCVFRWRLQQERELAQRTCTPSSRPSRLMDESQLRRFLQHYERLTRWALADLPKHADAIMPLDRNHQPTPLQINPF